MQMWIHSVEKMWHVTYIRKKSDKKIQSDEIDEKSLDDLTIKTRTANSEMDGEHE